MTSPVVDDTEPVVLDRAVLDRLGAAIGDHQVALNAARRFLDLLPQRVRRLEDAVADAHCDRALDVVLTIKVTAATVGGRTLERAAHDVELSVRAARWAHAVTQTEQVRHACEPLAGALRRYTQENR